MKPWLLMAGAHIVNPCIWFMIFVYPATYVREPTTQTLVTFAGVIVWFFLTTSCMSEIEGFYSAHKKGLKWR